MNFGLVYHYTKTCLLEMLSFFCNYLHETKCDLYSFFPLQILILWSSRISWHFRVNLWKCSPPFHLELDSWSLIKNWALWFGRVANLFHSNFDREIYADSNGANRSVLSSKLIETLLFEVWILKKLKFHALKGTIKGLSEL